MQACGSCPTCLHFEPCLLPSSCGAPSWFLDFPAFPLVLYSFMYLGQQELGSTSADREQDKELSEVTFCFPQKSAPLPCSGSSPLTRSQASVFLLHLRTM